MEKKKNDHFTDYKPCKEPVYFNNSCFQWGIKWSKKKKRLVIIISELQVVGMALELFKGNLVFL